jgi:hypothetical protein
LKLIPHNDDGTKLFVVVFYLSLFLLLPLGAYGINETLFSLQFLNLRQSVGLLGWGISLLQSHYVAQDKTDRE